MDRNNQLDPKNYMKLFRNFKKILYKADFFHTDELLRYKDQPQYRTLFGGMISIIIIGTLIATFYGKFLDTLNKVSITSITTTNNAVDPIPFNLSTFKQGNFMFGVEIWHHDLNTGDRYFDIVMTSAQFDSGEKRSSSIEYQLQPCRLSHWEDFPQISQAYTRLKMDYWLCLPKNKTYNVQGKYASNFSQTLQLAVKKCTNSSKYSRPCATQQKIDQYFKQASPFYFTIYFINPLINANSQDYLTYYMEDTYFIMFNKNLGSQAIIKIEDYVITTDQSILPYSSIKEDKGGIITQVALKNSYELPQNADMYCIISIFKSPISRKIERKFQKMDEILSYVGGLLGTVAFSLFIVKTYNSNSFEITLGAYLFQSKDEQQGNNFKKYNFLSYAAHLIYQLLNFLRIPPKWRKMKKYFDCRQEMRKQLDILYLLKRVFFLEKIVQTMLDEHQLKGLHLHEKYTLEQAKKHRQNFQIKSKLAKFRESARQKFIDEHNFTTLTQQGILGICGNSLNSQLGLLGKSLNSPKIEILVTDNKTESNPDESSEIEIIKELSQLRYNPSKQDQVGWQYDSDSSDDEQDERKSEILEDIRKLKAQSQQGNSLSKRIWEKINPSLKRSIKYISVLEKKDIHQKLQSNFAKEKPNEQVDFNPFSPDSMFVRATKLKMKTPKRSVVIEKKFNLKERWRNSVQNRQNVISQN